MAKLENLKEFDKQLAMARNDIRTLSLTRGHHKGVWSEKQEIQFNQLLGGVGHLIDALTELVHNNR